MNRGSRRNKNTPDRDTTDAIRNNKLTKKGPRDWKLVKVIRNLLPQKKHEQNIPLPVPITNQAIGEPDILSSTASAERQEHASGSSSQHDQHRSSTIAKGVDNNRKQKSAERDDYFNSTGYNINGPSNEPTGTKRGAGHSRDGSTKRFKHDDHDPRENELVHAEIREKQLQKKIDSLTAAHEDDKAKAAQYIQQWELLQQEIQNIRRAYAEQENQLRMVKERAEQETQANIHAINVYETRLKDVQEENHRVKSALQEKDELLAKYRDDVDRVKSALHEKDGLLAEYRNDIDRLKSALQEKDGLLAEYRDDIVKLSNERPNSKRDDHYFEQHFSQIFRSIHSWVLQYYLMVNPSLENSDPLHPLIQEFLQATAGLDGLAILQSEPVYTIQAYIASQMTVRILRPFLLGLMEDSFERLYNIVAPRSGGEKLAKWRISTIKMCMGREEFANEVSTKMGEIASDLVASLATLLPASTSPQYKPVPRTRKLKAILEQAAQLALEVQQEPSTIAYINIDPSTVCIASHASDAKGLRSDDDLEASGARVRLTVYPAVVRTPYNEPEEIVLVKAKVLTVEPSDT